MVISHPRDVAMKRSLTHIIFAALCIAALSGCATVNGNPSYVSKYPLCGVVPSGVLGCK
jgi:outer membrane protein assembly factor BamE (lipoprotein component of BamABCDE complex)